jgi:Flp pilus assembly protein TadD
VLFAAFLLRAIFALETAGDPLFHALAIDARSYHEMAKSVAGGDVLLGTDPLWFAPLYPLFLGALYRAFGVSPGLAILVQMALGIATAWFAWKIGSRFSRAAGLVAGLAVALLPTLLVYESQLLYTALANLLTAAFLLAFLTAAASGTAPRAGIAGALLGLLSLVASSAVLFAPLGAWRLWRRSGRKSAAVFLSAVALLLVPVLLRNGIVGGAWTPFPVNGGMLFGTGFSKDALGGRSQLRTPTDCGPNGSYLREAEAATGRRLSLADASRWHRDEALARIGADPTWAAGLVARKVLLLLNAREIDDNLGLNVFAERARTLRWLPAGWAWLLLPGVAGWALAIGRRDPPADDAKDVAWFALVFAASLLPFFVTARYRVPLVVPLAVLAGFAVASIAAVPRRVGGGRMAAVAAIVLALAAAALRDPGVREDPALALNAVGAALLNEGHAEEARGVLDRAVAADPALAAAHANRALALLALGRNDEALRAAREATRLDPGLTSAWITEGAILARAGAFQEALVPYRRATELSPGDVDALGSYARCLAATGDAAGAAAVGAEAVKRGARELAPLLAEWRAVADAAAGGDGGANAGADAKTPRP